MSRIGNIPVAIPPAVKVEVKDGLIRVEGKNKLEMQIPPRVTVNVEDSVVTVARNDESRESNALQGLARSLINNMVIGVT